VAQRWNAKGRNAPVGKPEFHRKIPVKSQPPRMALVTLPALLRNVLPRPIGKPTSQFAVML
jgi:hypothetical protein